MTDDASHTYEVRATDRPTPTVSPGLMIKVGLRSERFWCLVDGVSDDGTLVATIDNELVKNPDLECGGEIRGLRLENVLEVISPADEADFLEAARRAQREGENDAVRAAALKWWEERLGNGKAVPRRPDTLVMVGGWDESSPMHGDHEEGYDHDTDERGLVIAHVIDRETLHSVVNDAHH